MKNIYLLATIVTSLLLVGCSKENYINPAVAASEIAVVPLNSNTNLGTRGYVENTPFAETLFENLHNTDAEKHNDTFRTMQISSYLYPQNGDPETYFVDNTFAKVGSDGFWHNTSDGTTIDPIYWPVGGKLDFLAFSLTTEKSGAGAGKNVTVSWDEENAAQKVVLRVPAENSQNDILFSSVSGERSKASASTVAMTFKHAQAWLEFALKGSVDKDGAGIVKLKRIELENVYNSGDLTITNNGGNALAVWTFSKVEKKTVDVDNFYGESTLNDTAPMYLDMLIPQQEKTSFTIYYTLGSSRKELSYHFTTDQKTWLMGEKYIYNITISTNEITVDPTVAKWNENEFALLDAKPEKLTGLFSVSPTRKVQFARGNLWAEATYDEDDNQTIKGWHFEENQWEYSLEDKYSLTPKHISHLFASKGGHYGAETYFDEALFEFEEIVDWGVPYCEANMLPEGSWRTLSAKEWDYLLDCKEHDLVPPVDECRPGAKDKNGFAIIVIADVPGEITPEFYKLGLVILPDEFTDPEVGMTSPSFVPASESELYEKNIYSIDAWSIMEKAGAIFLPLANDREVPTKEIHYDESYWSSTGLSEDEHTNVSLGHNPLGLCTGYKAEGLAVRLVSDVE